MLSHSVVSDMDLSLAKTHGAWLQDLMKLRLLMFHCKNSVRDTVIRRGGFVWMQREAHSTGCGPSQRVRAAMECGVVNFFERVDFIC